MANNRVWVIAIYNSKNKEIRFNKLKCNQEEVKVHLCELANRYNNVFDFILSEVPKSDDDIKEKYGPNDIFGREGFAFVMYGPDFHIVINAEPDKEYVWFPKGSTEKTKINKWQMPKEEKNF